MYMGEPGGREGGRERVGGRGREREGGRGREGEREREGERGGEREREAKVVFAPCLQWKMKMSLQSLRFSWRVQWSTVFSSVLRARNTVRHDCECTR